MDKLDEYLGIIIDKIESALSKLALVERTKSTKYESMSRILDAIIDQNDGCECWSLFIIVKHF